MMIIQTSRVLITIATLSLAVSIGVPLHNGPRCMVIQGEFDVPAE